MRSDRGAALFVRDSFCHYVLTFAQIMYPVVAGSGLNEIIKVLFPYYFSVQHEQREGITVRLILRLLVSCSGETSRSNPLRATYHWDTHSFHYSTKVPQTPSLWYKQLQGWVKQAFVRKARSKEPQGA